MAPRKRKAENGGEEVAKKLAETTWVRVTRSATRSANSNAAESAAELAKTEVTKKSKKGKVTGRKKKEKEEVKSEENESDKEKLEEEEKVEEDIKTEKEKSEEGADGDEPKGKTVVIEHCKQCNSFKTRANQVRDRLEKGVPRIKVLLNPEKPRRGCFEIREEGGKKFISLLDMKRPFKLMKDLDMNEVISDIIADLK